MKKIMLCAAALLMGIMTHAQIQGYNIGDVVDDFTVTDTEGNEHTLYDITASGKYVYLDFFFVDCVPCQETAATFNEFHDKYGCNQGDLFMMSINGTGDSDAAVIAFEDQFGGTFNHAVAVSTDGGGSGPTTAFNPVAYPTYCMIGPDNTLRESDIWNDGVSIELFESTFPDGSNIEPMECSLGLNDSTLNGFTMYPNPSNGEFTVSLPLEYRDAEVIIYNTIGTAVYSRAFEGTSSVINVDLATGAYIVSIKSANNIATQTLLVK